MTFPDSSCARLHKEHSAQVRTDPAPGSPACHVQERESGLCIAVTGF